MHCSRLTDEFLHLLLIFAGLADAHQAIESTPLSTFLHFMHFLLSLAVFTHPDRTALPASRDDGKLGPARLPPGALVSDERCIEQSRREASTRSI
jgi:hypothetical protein